MNRWNGLRVESLEDRLAPAIVAVNGGGNTPNGTYVGLIPVEQVRYTGDPATTTSYSNGNFPPGQFPSGGATAG
jgi:hypothetical protein